MENGSTSTTTCCMMSFGNNSGNGLCPITMMPLMTSSHPHPPLPHLPDHSSNTLFPPLLPPLLNSLRNNHNCNTTADDHSPNTNNSNPTTGYYFMDSNTDVAAAATATHSNVKAKIMSHPHFQRLLAAYANCQKVGAPVEVVDRLEEACSSAATVGLSVSSNIGEDPALDQFMEAYCEMLCKYEQELSKPFKEAMQFLQRVESQFKALTLSSPPTSACHETSDRNASSEEEVDVHNVIDPHAEDQALKGQLLRRYSGYLGSLKQEFMKKRKKGKLPKEARQQLLEWWNRHNKWPYPSESQKLALAESTGLDQKQINNWFINQRKRHWKPSEDMPFVVMDTTHPHYYVDNVLGHPFLMDHSSAML